MLSTAAPERTSASRRCASAAALRGRDSDADQRASRNIADTLKLLADKLAPQRRVVHAGDVIYQAGERFGNLLRPELGLLQDRQRSSADGREQVVSLKFRGDWLGFDGIADGAYSCDAVAMDTGDVWVIRYDALLAACVALPGAADRRCTRR